MRKIIAKFFIPILSCALLISAGTTVPVHAQEPKSLDNYVSVEKIPFYEELGYELIDGFVLYNLFTEDYFYIGNPNSRALGPVAVFVLGMLVGWVVDGVITYATGKSPADWVAYMISAAADLGAGLWRGATKLVMNNTTKKVSHGLTSSGCVVYSNGSAHCPMST